MKTPVLDRPWFFPVVAAVALLGHAFDLFGTYQYQPNFEHEANPLYVLLRPHGLRLTWPLVIACKLAAWAVSAIGLAQFLRLRRAWYPPHPASFREFLTVFLYGRPLTWVESLYKLPRSPWPSVWTILAALCLSGPLFAYFGYGNLASKYGWWQPGGVWFGRFWLDWGYLTWSVLVFPALAWLLWRDFQSETR